MSHFFLNLVLREFWTEALQAAPRVAYKASLVCVGLIGWICATLSMRASLRSLVTPLLHFQVSAGPIIPHVLFRCPTHGPCPEQAPTQLLMPSLSEILLCLRWTLRNAPFLLLFPLSHSASFTVILHCILTQVKSQGPHFLHPVSKSFTRMLKLPSCMPQS